MLASDPGFTLEDKQAYKDCPSTKLNTVLRLLQHHLQEDNRPPLVVNPEFEARDLIDDPEFPRQPHERDPDIYMLEMLVPLLDWTAKPRSADAPPDKIVIYVAFPSINPLIRQVSEHVLFVNFN